MTTSEAHEGYKTEFAKTLGVPLSRSSRLIISVVSVLSGVAGLVGWLGAVPALRVTGVIVFFLVGLGSAPLSLGSAQRNGLRTITAVEFMVASVILSLSVLIILGAVMSETGVWHPAVLSVAIGTAACLVHVVAIQRTLMEQPE